MTTVQLPPGVLAFADRGPDWAAFVDRLPRLVRELTDEWELVVDGEPTHGFCALVLPVRRLGEPAVLKLAFPDDEGEHEGLALQHWAGDGAVRLLSADPHRSALLLERLHPTDLTSVDVLEACELVAERYARLHVPAPPQLRSLTSYVERWTAQLAELPRDAPVPHRLVQQAVSLARELVVDEASTGTMIHADLHYENVLAGDREPWLVIDPKPFVGDKAYDATQHLLNCRERLRSNADDTINSFADLLEVDRERVQRWTFARLAAEPRDDGDDESAALARIVDRPS